MLVFINIIIGNIVDELFVKFFYLIIFGFFIYIVKKENIFVELVFLVYFLFI